MNTYFRGSKKIKPVIINHVKHLYLVFVGFSLCFGAVAQEGDMPHSFSYAENLSELSSINLPSLDLNRVSIEDQAEELETGKTLMGRVIPVETNMLENGVWTTLPNGSRICRMSFASAEALALTVYFSDFHLPQGTELYAYNPAKTYWFGPMNHKENNAHRQFLTSEIFGDEIILEYYEPLGISESASLMVRGVGNHYRYVYPIDFAEELRGGSEACEVDVACPEGTEWMDEANAVVRLQITDGGNVGLCTGALMNNTAWDFRQLLLTAQHCTEGVSTADLQVLQVKFNYQRPNCGSGSYPQARNRTGVVQLADCNCGGGFSGSDFDLFEIEDYISDTWNPYFAGWRSSSTGSASGVGIHHPAGDIKKISTYAETLLQGTYATALNAHWRVRWAATETNHGVTEGGSSGSPIFDTDHYVIGTLTGGASYCDSPNARDFYGKMSYHFYNNPNSASQKLEVWLDPIESGLTSMPGSYRGGLVGTEDVKEEELTVYPNPTNGMLSIKLTNYTDFESIQVFNPMGQLVVSERLNSDLFRMDLSDLSPGVYHISLIKTDGTPVSRKITRY